MGFSAQLWVSKFEIPHDLEKSVLVRIAGSHTNINTANANPNSCSDFEQLQPDGMAPGLGELCSLQSLGSQFIHKHIRQGREVQPQKKYDKGNILVEYSNSEKIGVIHQALSKYAFIQKYRKKVIGVFSGFDRLILRGTLRAISYTAGMMNFLYDMDVLLKDFNLYVERTTKLLRDASTEEAGG